MSTTATPKDCTYLAAGFVALNRIKSSNALCKALPALEGFNHACNSPDFMDEVDKRALCQLFCCCNEKPDIARKQNCVAQTLWAADAFVGYKGYYKAEVPFKSQQPVMSRNEPARATRGRPSGSRIPDVVVVNSPLLPPALSNVRKVYEMKFPGDSYSGALGPDGLSQEDAYKRIFDSKLEKNPLDEQRCNCERAKKERVLERASAYQTLKEQELSLVDNVNRDAATLASLMPAGRAARAVGAAAEAMSAVGSAAARFFRFAF